MGCWDLRSDTCKESALSPVLSLLYIPFLFCGVRNQVQDLEHAKAGAFLLSPFWLSPSMLEHSLPLGSSLWPPHSLSSLAVSLAAHPTVTVRGAVVGGACTPSFHTQPAHLPPALSPHIPSLRVQFVQVPAPSPKCGSSWV